MAPTSSTETRTPAGTTLGRLLRDGASSPQIERHLDALSGAERLREVLGITGKGVGRLYEAVADAPPLTLDEIVPASAPEGETFIFEGRNSLPLFSRFQKRFARVGETILGFNHQTTSVITGPGYFVAKVARGEGPHPSEPYFDYTLAPPEPPHGWPPYKPNHVGLSRAVYMDMHDYMRRVCKGVMVGKAYKLGVEQGAYFSLTRV